ncbi:hypothetical protein BHE74_00013586 [Ensete ventricosum]|nr:hypothetical protein BHE74_00013586 [Ensete ventricosum]
MGKKGELLDVMAGLYRNFLPPTGKAQFVTPLLLKCATRCFSSSPLSSFQSSNCNTTLSSEVEIDLVCMSGNGEIQRLGYAISFLLRFLLEKPTHIEKVVPFTILFMDVHKESLLFLRYGRLAELKLHSEATAQVRLNIYAN